MDDATSSNAVTLDLAGALNPAQLAAVTAPPGPHLVVAGAGTGKTRTLVYRLAHLVAEGELPQSILLLTFTRRAAQEMLRRASAILDDRCQRVAGGTFHSFANLALRRQAHRLGYDRSFTVIDRADAADLVGLLRSEQGHGGRGRRFPRKDTLLSLFSMQVNTGRTLEDLMASEYAHFEAEIESVAALHQLYTTRKREHSVMDYDDLLVNLRDLLAEHEGVRQRLTATYRHVLVDEYQDTNHLQAEITALLAAGHGNLMVVGDDAQSIYAFRGADFRNILDFPQLFPDTATTVLEQNYRSTQPILDLGNAVLTRAREKFTKSLFTAVAGDRKPFLLRVPDEYSEAHLIAKKVLALREEGVPLGEIAVLSRAAWHTNTLEVELRRRNIPYQKFGGIRFFEAAHIKDVCALLKLSLNPLEATAWFRVLQLFEGVGTKTAQRIGQAVIDAGGDLKVLSDPRWQKRRFGASLAGLALLLGQLGDEEASVAARLATAVAAYQPLLKKKYDDAPRRARDFDSLATLAERYRSLERFLSDLAIDPPDFGRAAADQDTDDEWMTVSTVHSAKGLEWHSVFIIHLNAGQFPSRNNLLDEDDLDEERRLFYVAVTRAQKNLFLLKPEETGRGGYGREIGEMSPLLSDIPNLDALVETRHVGYRELEEDDAAAAVVESATTQARLARIKEHFNRPRR